jgi:hypothetical protein
MLLLTAVTSGVLGLVLVVVAVTVRRDRRVQGRRDVLNPLDRLASGRAVNGPGSSLTSSGSWR